MRGAVSFRRVLGSAQIGTLGGERRAAPSKETSGTSRLSHPAIDVDVIGSSVSQWSRTPGRHALRRQLAVYDAGRQRILRRGGPAIDNPHSIKTVTVPHFERRHATLGLPREPRYEKPTFNVDGDELVIAASHDWIQARAI